MTTRYDKFGGGSERDLSYKTGVISFSASRCVSIVKAARDLYISSKIVLSIKVTGSDCVQGPQGYALKCLMP